MEPTARRAIRDLGLPDETAKLLVDIYEELDRSYRDRFVELTVAVREQSAALRRIQETLSILVEAVAPQLARTAPVAFAIAPAGEAPDVASVKLEFVDPIAAGYTLSQKDLAEILGLDQPTVSILARAFKLQDDPECAVNIRRGKSHAVVNYRPTAAQRFRELVRSPPEGLGQDAARALRAARKRLQ